MKRARQRLVKKKTNRVAYKYFDPNNRVIKHENTSETTTEKNKLSFGNLDLNFKNPKSMSKAKKSKNSVDFENDLKQLEDPPLTNEEKKVSAKKLGSSFFDVPCIDLAQNLLGKILVRRLESGTILKGRIVETEAYLGEIDKASQTYQGKVTPRNVPMYMSPGTIYVYLTYGMYHCFNISSGGKGCAVLIRALEPIDGMEEMRHHRNSRVKSRQDSVKNSKPLKDHELCSGPSKLCIAMQIDKTHCKYSICNYKSMWIENEETPKDLKIVKSARIGIDRAGQEWANKPLRYYVYGNTSVSKRDKKAEAEFLSGE